jgi:lysine-ketoglutarate reductase/saccharopine dehydrogenase-like protein (TIGR00300 family)
VGAIIRWTGDGRFAFRQDDKPMQFSQVLEADGHLIDSDLMTVIFDKVIERGGTYEILDFRIGRTNEEFSHLTMKVGAPTDAALSLLVEDLLMLGCHPVTERDVQLRATDRDGCAPEEFYSTTNHRTQIRMNGRWIEVDRQRMDAVIVVEEGHARCRKLRDVRAGDRVVCGIEGIRVLPEFRERDRLGFAFMSTGVSSERRVEVGVARVAEMIRQTKAGGHRVAFVVGPVVVHTGGIEHLSDLIRRGYVDVLLAGNALAVHDIEFALYGTSLGVDLEAGTPVEGGHRHHMRAINTIVRAGGIASAVEQGILRSGVMHECVRRGVEYVLAGSIRDDGPLPETMMDLVAAQDRYAAALAEVRMVLILSTTLHGVGVGNMVPAWIRIVAVDINPAVVTKIADRGSTQTLGLVTDVGLFLHYLAKELQQEAPAWT